MGLSSTLHSARHERSEELLRELALGLKNSPAEVKEGVFRNMSKRAASKLSEEIDR